MLSNILNNILCNVRHSLYERDENHIVKLLIEPFKENNEIRFIEIIIISQGVQFNKEHYDTLPEEITTLKRNQKEVEDYGGKLEIESLDFPNSGCKVNLKLLNRSKIKK